MAHVASDPFSQVPLFVKTKFGITDLATATAFFYRHGGSLYLISNWHVFSGRDPETKKPLSNLGGIPDAISCYACLNDRVVRREWLDLRISGDDGARWYQHPVAGSAIDIGALPVVLNERFKAIVINDFQFTNMTLRVSHDVFILGYPLGITNSHGLPVWKRASVASEPGTSEPKYLVDTATRSGMSGSPVIFRYRGFYKSDFHSKDIAGDDWFGEGDMFSGVYSSRLGASQVEAQLGVVWKPHLIDEVIEGRSRAEC